MTPDELDPCPCPDCTYQRDNRAGGWLAVLIVLIGLVGVAFLLAAIA